MPLPMMAGDPATMMMQPGMQPPPPAPPPMAAPGMGPPADQGAPPQADPRAQSRGALELIAQIKSSVAGQLEGLARQFPGSAKSANQAVSVLGKLLDDVMRDVIVSQQTPEPAAPTVLH